MTRRVRGPLDGPLLPYGPGFEAALTDQGYSADSIGRHLRLMVHLSRWLAEQHLAAGDLTARCARRFLRFRQAQGQRHPASMTGMAPLLDYLGSAGAAPAAEPQAAGPMDARNTGTSEPLGTATRLLVADQEVFYDPKYRSELVLSVVAG